jgi:hypothetical protein
MSRDDNLEKNLEFIFSGRRWRRGHSQNKGAPVVVIIIIASTLFAH